MISSSSKFIVYVTTTKLLRFNFFHLVAMSHNPNTAQNWLNHSYLALQAHLVISRPLEH